MDTVVIGSGNAAFVLGRALHAAGHRILQVAARNAAAGDALASELGAEPVRDLKSLTRQAAFCLVAVADTAIPQVAASIAVPGLVAHCAGSVPMDALRPAGERYGVFYPLQTLRKEIRPPQLTMLIDGSDAFARETLTELAQSIAATTIPADDDKRGKYHVAAVIANNFTNYLMAATERYCAEEKIDFALLRPLIEETVNRLRFDSASRLQTGPAVRRDQATIEKHLAALAVHPELRALYAFLSERISADISLLR